VRVITAAPDPGPSPPLRGSRAATGAIRARGVTVRAEFREAKSQRATIAIRILKRPAPSLVSAATCDLSTYRPLCSSREFFRRRLE
jgi:hypothetical protein